MIRLLTALVAVLVTFTLGCGDAECDGHYTASSAFTPDEWVSLTNVAARWSVFLGRGVSITPGHPGVCHITPVDTMITDPRPAMGLEKHSTGNIYIVRTSDRAGFETALAHEIGHGFGLEHVDDPAAIMAGAVGGPDFTTTDLAECRRVGVCLGP